VDNIASSPEYLPRISLLAGVSRTSGKHWRHFLRDVERHAG
jgi:hypothetical protein